MKMETKKKKHEHLDVAFRKKKNKRKLPTRNKIQHGCPFGIIPSLSYSFSIIFFIIPKVILD